MSHCPGCIGKIVTGHYYTGHEMVYHENSSPCLGCGHEAEIAQLRADLTALVEAARSVSREIHAIRDSLGTDYPALAESWILLDIALARPGIQAVLK